MSPAQSAKPRAVQIKVTGVVQGVGMRYRVRWAAEGEQLTGWVRNEVDGSVTMHAEGPGHRVEQFQARLHRGFPGVVIERMETSPAPVQGHSDFQIVF